MRGYIRHILSLWIACVMSACGAHTNPYRFIFVEKERKLYALKSGEEQCVISGFDVIPKDPEEQKYNEVKLVNTFENCGMKEVIIMDDKTRVMWGVPIRQEPKSKGKMSLE